MTDRNPAKILMSFLPGNHHLADLMIVALEAEGYHLCRLDGGVHEGSCPTCGCEPVSVGQQSVVKDQGGSGDPVWPGNLAGDD